MTESKHDFCRSLLTEIFHQASKETRRRMGRRLNGGHSRVESFDSGINKFHWVYDVDNIMVWQGTACCKRHARFKAIVALEEK